MKKIKILMLNCEFPPIGGGAATATWYLLKEFSKIKNIYVDLITSSPSNEFQLEAAEEHINIHKLPIGKHAFHYWTQMELFKYSWRSYNYIKKALKENEYDLCHAFFGIPCGPPCSEGDIIGETQSATVVLVGGDRSNTNFAAP